MNPINALKKLANELKLNTIELKDQIEEVLRTILEDSSAFKNAEKLDVEVQQFKLTDDADLAITFVIIAEFFHEAEKVVCPVNAIGAGRLLLKGEADLDLITVEDSENWGVESGPLSYWRNTYKTQDLSEKIEAIVETLI
jgi:hypothetical protein